MSTELQQELLAFARAYLEAITPSPEDRHNFLLYAREMAECVILARQDPAQKEAAIKSAEGYRDAMELMVSRYEIQAASEAERRLMGLARNAIAIVLSAI